MRTGKLSFEYLIGGLILLGLALVVMMTLFDPVEGFGGWGEGAIDGSSRSGCLEQVKGFCQTNGDKDWTQFYPQCEQYSGFIDECSAYSDTGSGDGGNTSSGPGGGGRQQP